MVGCAHAVRFLLGVLLLIGLVGLPACERGAPEADAPEPDASGEGVEEEPEVAEQEQALRPGAALAFGRIPLPEGVVPVLRDAQMETFRITEDLEAVVTFMHRHTPPHTHSREGMRHRFALLDGELTAHVYAEGRAVRIAVVREAPPADVAFAPAAGASEGEDSREGPRRIVMGDDADAAATPEQAAQTATGSRQARVQVPGARNERPVFLEEPGGQFSEVFHVPPGYLPNLPRDEDGYLRIRPSEEQRRAMSSRDGSPPRFFVPTNPGAGF